MTIVQEKTRYDRRDGEARKEQAPVSPGSLQIQELEKLPIWAHRKEIQKALLEGDSQILIGETGSGKTTGMYPSIRDLIGSDDHMIITEPRKKATRDTADRVATLVGSKLGEEVGFQYRGGRKISKKTKVTFNTDGLLIRRLQDDPSLSDPSLGAISQVMIDEVHERSANIDIILGLLKHAQRLRKENNLPPLKIIAASATLETENLKRYLSDAPIIEVKGRRHKIVPHFSEVDVPIKEMPAAAVQKTIQILEKIAQKKNKEEANDILIFMPGKAEIGATQRLLEEELKAWKIDSTEIHTYTSGLTKNDEMKLSEPSEKTKIIIATNAAEVGVTLPRLSYVIDSGLVRQTEFDMAIGEESLVLRECAQSQLLQREGRVGRIKEGIRIALYTKENFEKRRKYQMPEIARKDLCREILTLKKCGVDDVYSFDFIEHPPKEHVDFALKRLREWNAIDEKGNLTDLGEKMAAMQIEPRHAYMILQAEKLGCTEEAVVLTAMIEELKPLFKGPNAKEAEKQFQSGQTSDFMTKLAIWKDYQIHKNDPSWFEKTSVDPKTMESIQNTRNDLAVVLDELAVPMSSSTDTNNIEKMILLGYLDKLMIYDSSYHAYRMLNNNEVLVQMDKNSSLVTSPPTIIIGSVTGNENRYYSQLCQKVSLEMLRAVAPHLVEIQPKEKTYDFNKDQAVAGFRIMLKNTHVYEDINEFLHGAESTDVIAGLLADNEVDILVIKENTNIVHKINSASLKENKKIFFDRERLKKYYKDKIGTISTIGELKKALEENKIDLRINPDDYNHIFKTEISSKSSHSSLIAKIANFFRRIINKIKSI